MSEKLDQSLDQILSTQRRSARPGRPRRHKTNKDSTAPASAPIGGVNKKAKTNPRTGKTSVPTGPSGKSGDGKIIVNNLPSDVTEKQIKDYFAGTIGPVKKVLITYGPNGVSRGIATVVFNQAHHATKALNDLNGVLVDGRPMKIEVVLDAASAPLPKTLSERVAQPKSQPKAQPKPATDTKSNNAGNARGRGARGRGRGRNAGRPKPKTADELDAEMADYWGPTGQADAASAGGAPVVAQPVATNGGGDVGMDDEVL